jgi:DNA (cytosine-5)-methyltransferase 1
MKYFSLFSGIGGLDWGLKKKGFDCIGFSEIKESSIEVFKRENPGVNNFGDITKLDFESLPDFDVLTGGFPCQSFSLNGLRGGFDDRRGKMIFYIYDLLKTKKPQFAVLENVEGILTHDNGKTYKNVFRLLAHAGYFVRCILLNACHYGSAQNRRRVLFLCSKNDFEKKNPEIIDDSKRFRDIRDFNEDHFVFVKKEITGREYGLELIGGYDRVGTLLTSRGNRFVREGDRLRYLTELEAERLQGFPDEYTRGLSSANRWFALGNAVNCNMSDYVFNVYLNGLWW